MGIKSASDLLLPNFLGIGPGQSGSTWLFEHLSQHPQVYIPPIKEVNYFNRNLHRYSLRKYSSQFRAGNNLVIGEISPGYSVLRTDRLEYLSSIMPDVQLILTIRHPVERSWSAARRVMNRLGISLEEFGEEELYKYFKKEWAYRAKNGKQVLGDYEPDLLEGQYTRVIDHWLRFFPEEQLLLVFFNQLKEDPQAYLGAVCQHIGVNPKFTWQSKNLNAKVNSNPVNEISSKVRDFLEDMYKEEIEQLRTRFGNQAID